MTPCQDDGWIPDWLINSLGGAMGFGHMEEDAYDYRINYAALDAALNGETRVVFDVGEWSDGEPVTPVEVIRDSDLD